MNQLAILTTAFNHCNNPYFVNNWHKFLSNLTNQKLLEHLFVCEILPIDASSIIDHRDINHWVVRNNSILWHKESGLNYLLDRLPSRYDAVVVIDNDILIHNNEWYTQTLKLLDQHLIVQPYDTINYLLSNHGVELTNSSAIKKSNNLLLMNDGNPGMMVAYRRSYLDYVGGFYDECLIGGADVVNLAPFFFNIAWQILDAVCHNSIPNMINYIHKARSLVKKISEPATFLDNSSISHLFHGYWKYRQYHERYNILKNYSTNIDFKRNSLGFYETHNKNAQKQIESFFNQRILYATNNKPIITCSSKYGADSGSVLWLSPQATLNLQNIQQISLTVHNPHDLGSIEISIDNTEINISDLMTHKQQVIVGHNSPQTISISADKVQNLPGDLRELGLLISHIKIISSGSSEYVDYPLSDVI